MNAIELLNAVDKILDDPKKWTKGEYAKDHAGVGTYVDDPEAVCFCLAGAMAKAEGSLIPSGSDPYTEAERYVLAAANELYPPEDRRHAGVDGKWWSYANFNDAPSTDYIRVKAVISRARQLLKSHQKENNA